MKPHFNKGLFSNYYLDELLPQEEEFNIPFSQISNPGKFLITSKPNMKISFQDSYPLRKNCEKQIGLLIKSSTSYMA
jgi:hypothetical protein